MQDLYDKNGYRTNVGIVLMNHAGQVLIAKRIKPRTTRDWQFPQGGVKAGESIEQAMYRELEEEIGLQSWQVQVLASTNDWLRYRIPKRFRGHDNVRIGQKQRWFLLFLKHPLAKIQLAHGGTEPEFATWQWVNYWEPLSRVVRFKFRVYRDVLSAFVSVASSVARVRL